MKPPKAWLSHYDSEIATTLSYPEISLVDLFMQSAVRFSEHICMKFGNYSFTYRQTKRIFLEIASGLHELGVMQGTRVGLVLPNSPQFIFAYYGVLAAGGVVVPLNPVYTIHELENQIHSTQIRFVIGWDEKKELLIQLSKNQSLERLILTGKEDLDYFDKEEFQIKYTRKLKSSFLSFEELCSIGNDVNRLEAISPDQAAVFQFSGGTTGTPKAAVALHRNIVANAMQFREWLKSLKDGQEQFLTVIPLSHVYGMVIGLNVAVAMGATIHLLPDPRNTQAILETIEREKITFYPGVPSMYYAINQNPDVRAGRYDLRSIKACISGSAPLNQEIRKEFEQFTGGKLVEGYGLSEAPTATHCNPIQGENRNGSIGLPLPDVDCKLVPLADSPEGIGELYVRGPQVMSHYHEQTSETTDALVDGWLKTGDIARMDEDGYFFLLGRNKELIKVGGLQVWPREVEEVIAKFPGVSEVVVAGMPDIAKGEVVKAWIVMKEGQVTDAKAIQEFCRNELAHYKVPKQIEFIKMIPRTPVGKVLRRELVKPKFDTK